MNRDTYGISFSFLMHATILGACLYLLPALDLQPEPLVLDFSLIPSAGIQENYSSPPQKEEVKNPPPVLKTPLKPKQLAVPKPIKRVLPEAPPKPVIAKKVLTRPAEKILPQKEKSVREDPLPEAAELSRPVETETTVPVPVMQPQLSARGSNSPVQPLDSAGAPTSTVSDQEMELHYVKAHFVYIKKIIEKNINYPPMARRMGWQGKVVVSFIVCSNGEVENLQVVESSGHAQLDKNALETVKQVEPFPNPPVRVKLILPVTYKIT